MEFLPAHVLSSTHDEKLQVNQYSVKSRKPEVALWFFVLFFFLTVEKKKELLLPTEINRVRRGTDCFRLNVLS